MYLVKMRGRGQGGFSSVMYLVGVWVRIREDVSGRGAG